jgi:hypothetical protein
VGGRPVAIVSTELTRLRQTERWIAWVHLLGVPLAVLECGGYLGLSAQKRRSAKPF